MCAGVCVDVYADVCMRVRACVRACVHARARVCVFIFVLHTQIRIDRCARACTFPPFPFVFAWAGYPTCLPLVCRSARNVLFGAAPIATANTSAPSADPSPPSAPSASPTASPTSAIARGWFGVNATSADEARALATRAQLAELPLAMPQAYGRSAFGTGAVDVSDAFVLHELNGRSITHAVRPLQPIGGSDDSAVGNFSQAIARTAGVTLTAQVWSFVLWQAVSLAYTASTSIRDIAVNRFAVDAARIVRNWSPSASPTGTPSASPTEAPTALSADVPRLALCSVNTSALHATAETVAVTDAYLIGVRTLTRTRRRAHARTQTDTRTSVRTHTRTHCATVTPRRRSARLFVPSLPLRLFVHSATARR
jgi:hypothetical protein